MSANLKYGLGRFLWAVLLLCLGSCGLVSCHLFRIAGFWPLPQANPFAAQGLCFAWDAPGATDRYQTFTPVTCQEPQRPLGASAGADYARLRFTDWDGDGLPEAMVETDLYPCRYSGEYCGPYRTVWKVCPTCDPAVTVLYEGEISLQD